MSESMTVHGDYDEEMAEFLQTFLDETEEQLDDLVETMLLLEGGAKNADDLNEAFRLIHSIKGSAGMMGLGNITVLTHHLENRFERFRSGTELLDEPTMNLVLRCIDFLRQCTKRLRDQEKLGSPTELLDELMRLETHNAANGENSTGAEGARSARTHDASSPALATVNSSGVQTLSGEASALRILVRFRAGLPLADLKAQLIITRISNLGEIQGMRPDIALLSDPEEFDEFELQLLTDVDQQRIREAIDVDGVETIEFLATKDANAGGGELGISGDPFEVNGGEGGETAGFDEQDGPLCQPQMSPAVGLERDQGKDATIVDSSLLVSAGRGNDLDDASAETLNAENEFDLVSEGGSSARSDVLQSQVDGALAAVSASENESSTVGCCAEMEVDAKADRAKSENAESVGLLDRTPTKLVETMRVDISRLDNLMNLAGELVVNRARFVQLAGQMSPALRNANMHNRVREFCDGLRDTVTALEADAEIVTDRSKLIHQLRSGLELMDEHSEVWEQDRYYVDQIDEAIDQLSLVSSSLQKGVLDTRMIPVGPLFNRFKRLVRDMSKEWGKPVELQIQGEKTELDKRMIDELSDPLLHLIRNSFDHGMESPEVRAALGKSETGKIELEATHSGNNVYIHVRDDGGGISVEKIRAKLVNDEILSATAAAELTDSQALDYIWHPGFSTARQITDISGRGVGMDVVQDRIRQLSGSIEIDSQAGRGTEFTIRLPLTLAIINCLLVRIHGIVVSIPIDSVREIVSVTPRDVVTVQGKETFDVRDEFMPLVGIDDIFEWHETPWMEDNQESMFDEKKHGEEVVVLQSSGKAMGLKVDELLGSQDLVVKSLLDNFIEIRGLSGASILGDGSVCLILDVASAFELANGRDESDPSEFPKSWEWDDLKLGRKHH